MKKNLILLVIGMVVVIIGALLKIYKMELAQYFLFAGLAIEAFALGSLVIKSLKNVK